jgi:hypothetical protein
MQVAVAIAKTFFARARIFNSLERMQSNNVAAPQKCREPPERG